MKQKTIEEISKIVRENSNCELLSKSYEGAAKKLTFKCHCGTEFQSTINNFINKKYKECNNCSKKTKTKNIKTRLTYEEVRHYVQQNSKSTLISESYTNTQEKLHFRCECGSDFYASFKHFKYSNQKQCKECGYSNGANKQRDTHENFVKIVKNILGEEYEVLSKYQNNSTDIKMLHKKCGREYTQKASKIKSGQRCSHCYAPKKRTIEEVRKEVFSICGDSLELYDYKGSEEVLLKCSCGHILKRTMSQIRKRKGAFCSKCKSSVGARIIENFLTSHSIKYEKEYRFQDCKFKKELPFDFYLPDYNTCIEYDGEQHFRPLKHWGGEKSFQIRKTRDKIKDNFCKENNIKLLRISYKQENCIEEILKENMLISC